MKQATGYPLDVTSASLDANYLDDSRCHVQNLSRTRFNSVINISQLQLALYSVCLVAINWQQTGHHN